MPPPHPVTPDGRYFVVRGRLWRTSDPRLTPEHRRALVGDLMAARRAVRTAAGEPAALAAARDAVDAAKVALGERGPVWWRDGAPDLNRRLARSTPYADWYATLAGPTVASRDGRLARTDTSEAVLHAHFAPNSPDDIVLP